MVARALVLSLCLLTLQEHGGVAAAEQPRDPPRLLAAPLAVRRNGEIRPSFAIADNEFVRDGEAFRIRGGCLHYFRVHPFYWRDRMLRMKALGLNAVESYVPWSVHEPRPSEYEWSGGADLEKFLALAKELDLVVLLRAGPYMCSEWDLGGLPAWLLGHKPPLTALRTAVEPYLGLVTRWWNILLPKLKPHLYENGGSVVMVQIENEYGSYGQVSTIPADHAYIEHLIAQARTHLGPTAVLYTTDGGSPTFMAHGSLNGSAVYTVGDWGAGKTAAGVQASAKTSFDAMRNMNPPGKSPALVTEFYPATIKWPAWGVLHWGVPFPTVAANLSSLAMQTVLDWNGSFVHYMGVGGTSPGYHAGANCKFATTPTPSTPGWPHCDPTTYQPDISSYDSGAPIAEGGHHNIGQDGVDLFEEMRHFLASHPPPHAGAETLPAEPALPPRMAFGVVSMNQSVGLLETSVLAAVVDHGITAARPLPVEQWGCYLGFSVYTTIVPDAMVATSKRLGANSLQVKNVRDRVYVSVAGVAQPQPLSRVTIGGLRSNDTMNLTLPIVDTSMRLQILVENMGRINYGIGMINENKGITDKVLWNGVSIQGNWSMACVSLTASKLAAIPWQSDNATLRAGGPRIFRGEIEISTVADTWLNTRGWGKGQAFVNGANLGRYWEAMGPQHALYVPAPLLKQGLNFVVLLELEPREMTKGSLATIQLTDRPDFTHA